jgi:hypothetical protein
MNEKDLADMRIFANIRADSGHEEHYVYKKGNSFQFGKAPETPAQFAALVAVGNQEFN